MKNRFFSIITGFLALLLSVVSCGDTDDLLGGDQFKLEVVALEDGDVLVRGQTDAPSGTGLERGNFIFFRIKGNAEKNAGLTLIVELFDPEGAIIAGSERTAPQVNVDLPIEIPAQFDDGQYQIVLSLLKGDLLLSREDRDFFLVSQAIRLAGIQSFPLIIPPSQTALLIAEVDEPAGLNPYLTWTRGDTVIATGLLSDGYNQILWEAPDEEGVYSIKVEVFPFPPPRGTEYRFGSIYRASAELFITPRDQVKVEEKKPSPQYDLFDIYISALRERERIRKEGPTEAEQVLARKLKRPYPVIYGDQIAMRFNGQAGFVCPELIFPVQKRPFKPFALSLGFTLEGDQEGRQILSLMTDDAELAIDFFFNDKSELILRLKVKNEEYFFPSGISKLEPGVRYLVEFSVSEQGTRVRTSWRLNGALVSDIERDVAAAQGEKKGYTVIGGANGIRCVVDTLDIILQ